MPDPLLRLRGRPLFVPGSGQASIMRASSLARPVFADSEGAVSDAGGFKGLFQPALHEAYGATADQPALIGFGLGVLCSIKRGPVVWIRHEFLEGETGSIYPSGLREYGLDPEKLILVRVSRAGDLLQAGLEAARCKVLAGVLLEFNGEAPPYDLTASRRLTLAARANGVPLVFVRSAAHPIPSSAETRWRVKPLPSSPLAANAPGRPVFEAELLRSRRGVEPQTFVLEWNPDAGEFEDRGSRTATADPAHAGCSTGPAAPLSGPVVSFPVHGQAMSGGRRRAG